MRFDPKIDAVLNLAPRQLLFAEVWFNQVHEFSLDAFRVRAMNPVNSVRELLRSLESGSPVNDSDRRRIWGELLSVLEAAPLLQNDIFQPAGNELCLLVKDFIGKDKKDSAASSFPLIEAFGRELEVALSKHFIPVCIAWLTRTLMEVGPAGATDPDLATIAAITGQLLSCLVDEGWSLESLFTLYRSTFASDIVHTTTGQPYSFARASDWMFTRLQRAPKPYTVTFVINQVTDVGAFPAQVGDIGFSTAPPEITPNSSKLVNRMATPSGSRVFATMTVQARDGRIAGMRAAQHIEQVLDVVRYDFERNNFTLSEKFIVKKADGHKVLDVARMVPNQTREISQSALHQFMRRLGDLVSSGTLQDDSKDRIYSAFRLYRMGAEAGNLENKLVNWWTALEFLVKAGGGGGIGDAVENALYPTVTLAYLSKHLEAIRAALHALRVPLVRPDTGAPLETAAISLHELYALCLDGVFQTRILAAVAGHPYAVLQMNKFFLKIATPRDLAETLKHHERSVRWQIQRIYRARCDVVHSAGRVAQATLLCANLESYLKILLDNFLQSLHRHSTLRTPKEFFDRQRHTFDRVSAQLAKNDSGLLIGLLSRDFVD